MRSRSVERWVILLALTTLGCTEADPAADLVGERVLVVTVRGEPTCEGCRIEFEEVAVLGDESDPASARGDAAGRMCMVAQLGTGEFVFSGAVGLGELLVYPGSGPTARSIGRAGEGPGELSRLARVIVGPHDTIFVVDDANARLQVFTPSGRFVRSFPTPSFYRSVARLSNGDFVFNRRPTHPEDAVFYRLDGGGTEVARIGGPRRPAGELELDGWIVSPRSSGGFWVGNVWAYEIQRWNDSNEIDLVVRRDVPWFPADPGFPDGTYVTEPPPAFLDHVWEDGDGLLWVYMRVPDPEWEPGHGLRVTPEWFRVHFDNVVEVIDPQSARVVSRVTYDGMLGAVCGSELVYTVFEAPAGDTRVRVLRPVLQDRGVGR